MTTSTNVLGVSILKIRLGAALQRHRLNRSLTQGQLAELAHLSLKYVGEIERGEANTTLDVIERLAAAVGWNPMEALEGMTEPLSEGVRMLLLDEIHQMLERLRNMAKWLHALDPALQRKAMPPENAMPRQAANEEQQEAKNARPSRGPDSPQEG